MHMGQCRVEQALSAVLITFGCLSPTSCAPQGRAAALSPMPAPKQPPSSRNSCRRKTCWSGTLSPKVCDFNREAQVDAAVIGAVPVAGNTVLIGPSSARHTHGSSEIP
jgi:hypothetical protein